MQSKVEMWMANPKPISSDWIQRESLNVRGDAFIYKIKFKQKR